MITIFEMHLTDKTKLIVWTKFSLSELPMFTYVSVSVLCLISAAGTQATTSLQAKLVYLHSQRQAKTES